MEQIVSEKPYIEEATDESIYYQRLSDGIPYQPSFRLIDLFCGAGGFSLGFSPLFGHHFQHVWMNDIDPAAVKTYRSNFESIGGHEDILKVAEHPEDIPTADVVIGGPPCQGFSLLNKNRENDPRKQLWRPFMEIVRISHASVFVMENVPQLLGSEEYNRIKTLAQDMGFLVTSAKLCAADYGVPQTRWRAFIIGCLFADPKLFFPPRKTHYDSRKGNPKSNLFDDEYIMNPKPWRTVYDAISDLPAPLPANNGDAAPPLDLHYGRNPTPLSLKRYQIVGREGMNRFDLQRLAPDLTPSCWIKKTSGGTDLFGRLWWDRPAFTIRTEFFKPEKGRYLHPSQHRPITHREAARLQSFPDSFRFQGTKLEIARQIGNAVPPILAARIADSVYALLISRVSGDTAS